MLPAKVDGGWAVSILRLRHKNAVIQMEVGQHVVELEAIMKVHLHRVR